jgi:hypothetical protein
LSAGGGELGLGLGCGEAFGDGDPDEEGEAENEEKADRNGGDEDRAVSSERLAGEVNRHHAAAFWGVGVKD